MVKQRLTQRDRVRDTGMREVQHCNIASDNGLSPNRHQAIIWTNAASLPIRTLGPNLVENTNQNWYIFNQEIAFENGVWKMVAISLTFKKWITNYLFTKLWYVNTWNFIFCRCPVLHQLNFTLVEHFCLNTTKATFVLVLAKVSFFYTPWHIVSQNTDTPNSHRHNKSQIGICLTGCSKIRR